MEFPGELWGYLLGFNGDFAIKMVIYGDFILKLLLEFVMGCR